MQILLLHKATSSKTPLIWTKNIYAVFNKSNSTYVLCYIEIKLLKRDVQWWFQTLLIIHIQTFTLNKTCYKFIDSNTRMTKALAIVGYRKSEISDKLGFCYSQYEIWSDRTLFLVADDDLLNDGQDNNIRIVLWNLHILQ